MVSWKIERKLYHANIKKELISKYAQLFFLTNPTDEQLEILEEREKSINIVFLMSIFLGFIIGILFSYCGYLFLKSLELI